MHSGTLQSLEMDLGGGIVQRQEWSSLFKLPKETEDLQEKRDYSHESQEA
jgi:hypothetical protein